MKRFQYFYAAGIFMGVVFLMIFCGVPLFTHIIDFADQEELRSFYITSCYLLLCCDCLFMCMRVSSDTVTDAVHLSLFPLSRFARVNFSVLIALGDYRIFLYTTFTMLMMADNLIHYHFGSAIATLLLMSALYGSATVWIIAGLNLGRDFIKKNRANIFLIIAFLVFCYNINFLFTNGLLLSYFPLTGTAGDGLFKLSNEEIVNALFETFTLTLTAAIGQVVLYFSPLHR